MMYLDADVARYLRRQVVVEDDALRAVGAKARELGVPAIAPEAGRVLQLLCRMIGARRVLEIGTCTGYSAIWIARGLPADGHLETLELDPQRAAMARAHFRQTGVAERVTVTVGDARETLAARADESVDAVFIDADKPPYPAYLEEALRLVRPGGLILADNVLTLGPRVAVYDEAMSSESVRALRRYNWLVATDSRLLGTILPVGEGLSVAWKVKA